jgi:hypothetical protein
MANYVFCGLFAAVAALIITFLATTFYKREGFADATETGHYILYTALSVLVLACVVAYFKK